MVFVKNLANNLFIRLLHYFNANATVHSGDFYIIIFTTISESNSYANDDVVDTTTDNDNRYDDNKNSTKKQC